MQAADGRAPRLLPRHFAIAALALALLLSPVSQLTPQGALGRVPFWTEALTLVALLARWSLVGLRPPPVRPLLWIGLGIAHAMLSGLWAVDASIWLAFGARTLHAALWVFALYSVVEDRDDLLALLRAFHVVSTIAAAVGIAQWLMPSLQVDFVKENTEGAIGAALVWDDELGSGSIVRVTGTLAHPLGLALLLTCSASWTPALVQAARSNAARAFWIAATGVQAVGLALTYSRMAVLALGAAAVWFVLRGGVRHRAAVLASLAAAAVAALPALPATLVERLFDPTHFAQSDSLIARLEMQQYGLDLGMEHGFVGIGYGCYGVAYEATARGRYVEQARWMLASSEHAAYGLGDIGGHNTYLEIWVEQGLPGLLLAALAIGSMATGCARRNRALAHGSLDRTLGLCTEAGLIALIASTVVIHMQEAPMPWIWTGLACAWLGLPRHGGPLLVHRGVQPVRAGIQP